jgi:triacylglycerol lipase
MAIVFILLGVVVFAVVAVTLLSYAFAWYEHANNNPQAMEARFAPSNLWFALRLVGLEAASMLGTVLVHPLGWLPPREKVAPPSGETPVLLLHGLFLDRACWLWIKYRLRRRGFRSVYTVNLPPWKDIETLTERVAMRVDELRHASGADKVHLVGHSLGGLIARNFLQLRGGADKVARCIQLAPPNGGSRLAPFALSPLGKDLLPGSSFLSRLAAAPLPTNIHLTTIFSRHDNMVLPWQNARLEGAQNIELAGLGHSTFLFAPHVLDILCKQLEKEMS